jgi:hypothetical protein
LATDLKGDYPIVAAVDNPTSEYVCVYTIKGLFHLDGRPISDDLIRLAPKEVTVEKWFNIVDRGYGPTIMAYDSKEQAIDAAKHYVVKLLARAVPFVWKGEME